MISITGGCRDLVSIAWVEFVVWWSRRLLQRHLLLDSCVSHISFCQIFSRTSFRLSPEADLEGGGRRRQSPFESSVFAIFKMFRIYSSSLFPLFLCKITVWIHYCQVVGRNWLKPGFSCMGGWGNVLRGREGTELQWFNLVSVNIRYRYHRPTFTYKW